MPVFLTKLRNKSDQEKKRILYIWTMLIMLVVILIWIGLFLVLKNDSNKITKQDPILNDLKSFGLNLGEAIKEGFYQIKLNFNTVFEEE